MTGSELEKMMLSSPQDGQRRFYEEYRHYVYTIIYSKLAGCAARQDMEECVSDVFADIFIHIERLYEMDDLSGITGLIAKRKAISKYWQLSGKKASFEELDENIPDNRDIAAETERSETARILFSKIAELGEPDATIILLSFYYEMNSLQISGKLSLNPAFVRKRKQRALKRLKKLLSGTNIYEE